MRATADNQGKVTIHLVSKNGDHLTFRVGGVGDVPFAPDTEVEIPDDRLAGAIKDLTAPFGGSGLWRRVDGN